MVRPQGKETAELYKIRLRGHLDQHWSDWFAGFKIEHHSSDTLLTGTVVDQAALHGILAKIRDLGLNILLVENFESEE